MSLRIGLNCVIRIKHNFSDFGILNDVKLRLIFLSDCFNLNATDESHVDECPFCVLYYTPGIFDEFLYPLGWCYCWSTFHPLGYHQTSRHHFCVDIQYHIDMFVCSKCTIYKNIKLFMTTISSRLWVFVYIH